MRQPCNMWPEAPDAEVAYISSSLRHSGTITSKMTSARTLLVLVASACICRGDVSEKILGNVIDKLHAHKHKSTTPPPQQTLGHYQGQYVLPGGSTQYQGQAQYVSAGGSAQHQGQTQLVASGGSAQYQGQAHYVSSGQYQGQGLGQYVYNPVPFQVQQTSSRPQSEVPLCVCRPWAAEGSTVAAEEHTKATNT